jgi:NADPH:quinone reductase-like Zn-dependent oxidoreductase
MRLYRLESIGSLDGLVAREEPVPSPGPGEVLLRVRATALNFRDLLTAMGQSPFPVKAGVVPMSDAAGEVEAVGSDVTRFQVGDRVVNSFFPTWYGGPRSPNPETYGSDRDGWLAEYKVVRAESLALAPLHLTYEEAATLPCAAVTAWSALAGVRAGDTVLTQGSGGVAVFALQLAKLLGARVIATAGSEAAGERLKQVGADAVIDYIANPEWATKVRELTAGRGVDRVVEVGGPGTLAQSIKAVAYGGEVSLVGALAAGGTGGLDFMSVFLSQATLRCVSVGSRSDLEAMMRAVDAHAMRPVVDRVFPFVEAKAAWAHYAGRKVFGKVVIRH